MVARETESGNKNLNSSWLEYDLMISLREYSDEISSWKEGGDLSIL
jgi:hypothetical protein